MRKLLIIACLCLALSACTGYRGTIAGKQVCVNKNLLGISISDIFAPCE